jgi:hypothetical protein
VPVSVAEPWTYGNSTRATRIVTAPASVVKRTTRECSFSFERSTSSRGTARHRCRPHPDEPSAKARSVSRAAPRRALGKTCMRISMHATVASGAALLRGLVTLFTTVTRRGRPAAEPDGTR